jgi:2-oxoisovalerate dehydrogenase E2 component (dihydrolipoyl transacylase)
MPTQVLMPQLGESVLEGTISKWLKNEGEWVNEFDPLLEVNTDKVDTEIPSPVSGILLKVLASEGQTIQAGSVLGWIGAAGEAVEETGGEIDHGQAHSPGRDRRLGFISPVVARLASEHNLDLSLVKGSGQGGRITKMDVLAYLDQQKAALPTSQADAKPTSIPGPPGPSTAPVQPAKAAAPPTIAHQPIASAQPGIAPERSGATPAPAAGDELRPLSAVRRAIAEHMVYSKHTSPHVTTVMEADLNRVVAHRSANKEAFARDGAHLTYTAYFIAASIAGLKAFPIVNSSWSSEGILLHRSLNIGIATSLGEAGLIVPVIKNAEALSLLGLARTINDLANRARQRQLQPDEVKGGTFTLTNHGISGSLFATPIINQPQCGILGVGAIQKRVVVASDASGNDILAIRPLVYISLTFDHRVLDGATADHFLAEVVRVLQEWA